MFHRLCRTLPDSKENKLAVTLVLTELMCDSFLEEREWT